MSRFLFLIILFFAAGTGVAVARPVPLSEQSSDALLGRAAGYIEADTLLDRAVAALTEVANRYYKNPDNKTARRKAVDAMIRLGKVYSYRLFDFPEAYNYLSTARMIAEEDGDDYSLADINVLLGNVMIVTADPGDEEKQAAIDSLLAEGFRHALAGNNEDVVTRHAVNTSIRQLLTPGWQHYSGDVKLIRRHRFVSKLRQKICLEVLDGMDAYFGKNYDKAESNFKRALAIIPVETYTERFVYGIMYLLQYVYEMKGDYAAEEAQIRGRLALAKRMKLNDYTFFTYGHLVNFFKRREKPDSVRKYMIEYLFLKDSLEENSGLNKVGNLEMLRQVERTNEEIRELSVQRQRSRRHLLIAVTVIAVVLLICAGFAYMSVRLRRNNRTLFARNRELLDLQEQYRRMISGEPPVAPVAADKPGEDFSELYDRVVKLMETSKEIYNPGFTIEALGALLHESPRSVSRAINSCFGQNFHSMLNGYRIREACRLMQEADRRIHTVEYIAEKAGFRSRTSFASLFKKTTGLTPSDYWSMAKNGTAPAAPSPAG